MECYYARRIAVTEVNVGQNVDVGVVDGGDVSVHGLVDVFDYAVDDDTKRKVLILNHLLQAQAEKTGDTSTEERLLDSRSCSSE